MSGKLPSVWLALMSAGCVIPSALTHGVRSMGGRVTPAAKGFAGATQRVVRLAGQAADGAVLSARVQAALAMRKGLAGCVIHVQAEEGSICLTGTAPTPGQRRLAAEVARQTVGVAGVHNRLRVICRANASGG